jgi:hypothetical protein
MLGVPAEMLRYRGTGAWGSTPMHIRGLAFASTNRWQPNSKSWTPTTACPDMYGISPECDPFDPRDIWALQVSD